MLKCLFVCKFGNITCASHVTIWAQLVMRDTDCQNSDLGS